MSCTLPTMGTHPHATGAVHNAARYAIRPLTAGKCGCVDGNKCSEMEGDRIFCGSGVFRIFGSSGDSVRSATYGQLVVQISESLVIHLLLPSFRIRSSGGLWSPPLPAKPCDGPSNSSAGPPQGEDGVNHSSEKGSGRTCARLLDCGRCRSVGATNNRWV